METKTTLENQNEYEEKIHELTEMLEDRIIDLKDKVEDVDQSARESYENKLRLLASRKNHLKKKLDMVRKQGWEEWTFAHRAIERELKHIGETYTGIKKGFSYLFNHVTSLK